MDERFEGNVVTLVGPGKERDLRTKRPSPCRKCYSSVRHGSETSRFANGKMERHERAKDLLISNPKIAEGDTVAASRRNPLPQLPITCAGTVATPIGNNLTRTLTEG